jgi:ribonucleoside-diphosphate reductase alpha chain
MNILPRKIQKSYPVRNCWLTTIAPTGTLSMIADCTNGVEPVFALAFEKRVTVGSFYYVNKYIEEALKSAGIYSAELVKKVVNNYGSCQGLEEIPEEIRRVFVTAMDIHYADHIYAQSVWQKHISNAIAKTINMPNDSTIEDVKQSYLLAHKLGLRGITVYRDGSRNQQVLHIHSETKERAFDILPSETVRRLIPANNKEVNSK